MLALQVGVAILGMHSQRVNVKDRESMDNAAIKIIGSLPSLVAAFERARTGLGRTFQAARLFPELTVRETVQVALEAAAG